MGFCRFVTDGSGGAAGQSAASEPQPTPSEPAAAFELVDVDAVRTVEINERFRLSFAVRNATESALAFTSRLRFRTPHAGWRTNDWITAEWAIEFPVPAGAERAWESGPTAFNNVAVYEFGLEGFDATWTVDVVRATRRFGDEFETLDGTALTVDGLAVQPTRAVGDRLPVGSATRLVKAVVSVENRTRHATVADEPADLVLVVDDRTFSPTPVSGDSRAALASPGVTTVGWVAFAVPASVPIGAGVVSWRPAHFDGPVRVDWRDGD